ncbi:MAG: xanthine dehydrogenase family protein subunit M [Desulfomonile tiedjei]|nr:xanthine dehydrogenase family protein subunit M [Desulfomonile tiedjei]
MPLRDVFLPRTLDDLWDTLEQRPESMVYAGGTDLFVRLRSGSIAPPSLVCLERLNEIKGVRDEGEFLFIGAATTHGFLLAHPLTVEHFPILAKALAVLASPPVRHMGTIGGNIVNASPAGDTLPPLYVLDAEIEISSRREVRRMPLADFIFGPGEVLLGKGEILTGVRVKKLTNENVHHYEKVGLRKGQACAVASLAALLRLSPSGVVEEARLAWGSVGPTVVTLTEVEHALTGEVLSHDTLKGLIPLVRDNVSPIDDVRASAEYRRIVAGQLLLRLQQYRWGGP